MSTIGRILRHRQRPHLLCPICNEPVSLESSKTDEDGCATHEDCYVAKVCKKSCSNGNHGTTFTKTGTSH